MFSQKSHSKYTIEAIFKDDNRYKKKMKTHIIVNIIGIVTLGDKKYAVMLCGKKNDLSI